MGAINSAASVAICSTVTTFPEMRAWTRVDEIASIQYDMTHNNWQEVGGNAKWDPRNPETADHSAPYLLARGLIDGDIYIDSFVPEKYPFRDPVVKALMDKITCAPVDGWGGLGTARITIRKHSGEPASGFPGRLGLWFP